MPNYFVYFWVCSRQNRNNKTLFNVRRDIGTSHAKPHTKRQSEEEKQSSFEPVDCFKTYKRKATKSDVNIMLLEQNIFIVSHLINNRNEIISEMKRLLLPDV